MLSAATLVAGFDQDVGPFRLNFQGFGFSVHLTSLHFTSLDVVNFTDLNPLALYGYTACEIIVASAQQM